MSQHSDSDGVLPRERFSLPPATSGSTQGSSQAEEEEELSSKKDSLERLKCSEDKDKAEGLSHQDSQPDEQVEDGSVLAAISCWHCRVTMVIVWLSVCCQHFHLSSNVWALPPPILHQLLNMLKWGRNVPPGSRFLPVELSVFCCMNFMCGTNSTELHVGVNMLNFSQNVQEDKHGASVEKSKILMNRLGNWGLRSCRCQRTRRLIQMLKCSFQTLCMYNFWRLSSFHGCLYLAAEWGVVENWYFYPAP